MTMSELSLTDFLSLVLPQSGIYNVFTTGDRRNRWTHSVEETAAVIRALGDRADIYYAVASFRQEGTEFKGRTQANVDKLKCFRLDLDAGPDKLAKHGEDKVYASWKDALRDVARLHKEGLTPSLIVHSGGGLHVYFVLDEEVSAEQWRPIAEALQVFVAGKGIKADAAVTADQARVLRPIGTRHPNGNTVRLLSVSDKRYTLDELVGVLAPKKSVYDTSVNDDIKAVGGPPKTIRNVIKNCAAMQFLFRNQATVQEPLWRLGIGITKHTLEGFKAAVAISCKHPQYDQEELRGKFDRWETGPTTCDRFADHLPDLCSKCPHRGNITSPIQLGAVTVDEVTHLPPEEVKKVTPSYDGKPWDGAIPPGFEVRHVAGRHTLYCTMTKVVKGEDGSVVKEPDSVPFTHDVFWFTYWADAAHTSDNAVVTLRKATKDGVADYTLDQSVLASRGKLLESLAGKAIHVTNHKMAGAAMESYVRAQLERIKVMAQRPKIGDRLGVRILQDGSLVAVQGKYMIRGDGTIDEVIVSSQLAADASNYSVPVPNNESGHWDKSVWKEYIFPAAQKHVEFMRRYYSLDGFENYQLAIMSALASPFMAFVADGYWSGATLPGNGLSVSLFSEHGGKGKTTAMRCAQLAFGSPAALNRDNDDLNTTAKARMARLSNAGTMPVSMDEMGDIEPVALAQLIRTVANGSGRARADRSGALLQGTPWALICLIGTNKPQREIINIARQTSSAEQFRLLELNVEKVPQFGVEAQTSFEQEWKMMGTCAGALGAVIHYAICRMGVEKVNKFVSERVTQAARMVQEVYIESASRFQYRALGAILAVFDVLETVGLSPFERQGVIDAFLDAYSKTIEFVDENILSMTGIELLGRMLQDLQPRTIVTQGITNLRNAGDNKRAHAYDIDVRGRTPLNAVARHVLNNRFTYVSTAAVKEWCDTNGVRERQIIMEAKANGILERPFPAAAKKDHKRWSGPFNLYAGMQENTGGSMMCYVINVKKLASVLGDTSILFDDSATAKVIDMQSAKREAVA